MMISDKSGLVPSSNNEDKVPGLLYRASTDDSSSPPQTPTAQQATLADVFPADGPDCPRPPQKNRSMKISEVHARMRSLLLFTTPEKLKNSNYGSYQRLCYVIGQDLDTRFPWYKRQYYAGQLLYKQGEIGKRFETLYATTGDVTAAVDDENETETFANYKKKIPGYEPDDPNSFTIFDSPDHPNVEPFYRSQLSGNCFLHAPILFLWYVALWFDTAKDPSEVPLVHLSRYERTKFTSAKLFNYIFDENIGRCPTAELIEMTKEPEEPDNHHCVQVRYEPGFDRVLKALQKYGPAIVGVDNVPDDFFDEGKLKMVMSISPSNTMSMSVHGVLLLATPCF